jgi:ABC-type multidrug transport system fused ATPase/permease subunit
VKISLGRLGDVLLHPDGKALMLIDKDAKRDITDDDKYRGHGSGSSQVDLQVENAMWQCGSSFVPTKVMEKDAPSTSVSDANASPAFSLGPVTFSASRGHVVGVVGGTGSGKSTLLLALLGELQIQNGDVNGRLTKACDPGIHDPPVGRSSTVPIDLMDRYLEASYCSQIPHIHSLNVRDNILMGRELDEVRYRQVLEGCQLHHDINEGNWHDGDLHDCGENGSALSGGQRLRLGVARALYSTKPIVLLDDPFSALDERTGTALMSFIREVVSTEQNRLVIVATHHVHLFRQANAVMVLDGGTVVGMGKYQDLHENEFFVKLLGEEDELRKKKQKEAKVSGAGNAVDSTSLKEQEVADKKSDSEDAPAETEAKKATDVVHKDHLHKGVIKIYADTFGTSTLVIWMFALFVVMATQSGNTVFVFEFPEHRGVISNTQFYIVAAFMFSSNFVAQYITTFYLYEGCLKVSRRVYQRLTRSVLYTFVAFFEVTSIGKIVNRFGKDTFAVDDLLPDKASRGVMLTMNVTGGIFLAIFFAWYSIPILIALVFAYYYLQDYYRQTARVLRRLDSAYQSPLYTLTCDCIGNSVTLRSLEPEVFSHFVRELENALDGAMRTSLSVRVAAVVSRHMHLSIDITVSHHPLFLTSSLFHVCSGSAGGYSSLGSRYLH